jgi:hypothetical protein
MLYTNREGSDTTGIASNNPTQKAARECLDKQHQDLFDQMYGTPKDNSVSPKDYPHSTLTGPMCDFKKK